MPTRMASRKSQRMYEEEEGEGEGDEEGKKGVGDGDREGEGDGVREGAGEREGEGDGKDDETMTVLIRFVSNPIVTHIKQYSIVPLRFAMNVPKGI